jgi:hypothetical protein
LLCGHFGIDLKTFLGASILGKAAIKANIQAMFTIFLFSGNHVDNLAASIES